MHDEIPVVDQRPPPVAQSFHAQRAGAALLLQRLLDVLRQRGDLPVRAPGAEQEVVRVSGEFANVQRADVLALLLLGQSGATKQCLQRGDGRLSSLFSAVQPVGGDVPLDLPRHEPADGTAPSNLVPDGARRDVQDRKVRAQHAAPPGEAVGTSR